MYTATLTPVQRKIYESIYRFLLTIPAASLALMTASQRPTTSRARREESAARNEDPRLHAEGRLLLAAGKEEPGRHEIPRSRKRLHRGGDEADGRRCRRRSTRRCSAASSRPTSACRRAAATTGITRAPKRASSIPYMCRRKGDDGGGPRRSCSTSTSWPKGTSSSASAAYAVSDDANWLAFSTDTTGYRQYTLQVKDLRTGDAVAGEASSASARLSGPTTTRRSSSPPKTPSPSGPTSSGGTSSAPTTSDLVYEEKDELFDLGAGRSLDKKVHLPRRPTRRRRARSATCPPTIRPATFKIVLPRAEGHEYDVDHYEGQFYITTNKGAKNFKVVTAPMSDPSEKNWNAVHPAQPDGQDRGAHFLQGPPRRLGARGRAELPARHRHEDEDVAPDRDRRTRLRDGPRRRTPSSTRRRFATPTSRW